MPKDIFDIAKEKEAKHRREDVYDPSHGDPNRQGSEHVTVSPTERKESGSYEDALRDDARRYRGKVLKGGY